MGLETVELVVEVEKEFGIKIPNELAAKIVNVHELCECVANIVNETRGARKSFLDVLPDIESILVEKHGISKEEITLGSRFVDDFGMD